MKDYNVPLNEDGSLDVEYIKQLSHEEKMKIVSRLSEKHFEAYCSTFTYDEPQPSIKAKIVPYTMEELIARGEGVEAFSFLEGLK